MAKSIIITLVASLVVILSGCSENDDPPKTLEESCDELISEVCQKEQECNGTDYSVCTSTMYQEIDCTAATKAPPERCLMDIKGQSCGVWNLSSFPASCPLP